MTSDQQDRMLFLALAGAVQAEQDAKDSMSDLSTEASMKLQLYQDRRSKMMETLSNMMKKSAETSNSIISNLK